MAGCCIHSPSRRTKRDFKTIAGLFTDWHGDCLNPGCDSAPEIMEKSAASTGGSDRCHPVVPVVPGPSGFQSTYPTSFAFLSELFHFRRPRLHAGLPSSSGHTFLQCGKDRHIRHQGLASRQHVSLLRRYSVFYNSCFFLYDA